MQCQFVLSMDAVMDAVTEVSQRSEERSWFGGRMMKLLMRLVLAAMAACLVGEAVAQTTVEYYHTDALGSVVAISDAAGQVVERNEFEPFGEDLAGTKDGPGFTGHVRDATTGLSYMQQRYYDPSIGRFISVDPVSANSEDGTNFNRYKYAANNPYSFIDPDGRREKVTGSHIGGQGFAGSRVYGLRSSGPIGDVSATGNQSIPDVPTGEPTQGASGGNSVFKNGNILDFKALAQDVAIPLLNSPQGLGVKAASLVAVPLKGEYNLARLAHIFRDSPGHVNPLTAATRNRFLRLFEAVAENPANLRVDAVQVRLITQHAADAGVRGFTQTTRSGQQVWVTVRDGQIINAGVNAAGAVR
jgi:RHS repeat-associated protein